MASADALAAPSWLTSTARTSFETHAARLQADQIITPRDTGALVVAAICEAMAATLLSKSELQPAERTELRQWLGLYRLSLGDLGSTPAARSRVEPVPTTDDDDPLDRILNGQ